MIRKKRFQIRVSTTEKALFKQKVKEKEGYFGNPSKVIRRLMNQYIKGALE